MCATCHNPDNASGFALTEYCYDEFCTHCLAEMLVPGKSYYKAPNGKTYSSEVALEVKTVTVSTNKTYQTLMTDLVMMSPLLTIAEAHEAILAELDPIEKSWTLTPTHVEESDATNYMGEKYVTKYYKHDDLVKYTLSRKDIMVFVTNEQKIKAIKELRTETKCTLKAGKDAVEAALKAGKVKGFLD